MSKFVQNLTRSGNKLFNRYQFRSGGATGTATFEGIFPHKSFVDRILKKERVVLYRTGRTMLRSYKKVLGKRPPQRFTKTGRVSTRYRREVQQGQRHPFPYRRTGVLREGTEFAVDEQQGTVIAGPYLILGKSARVITSKTVPQLLEEGGKATIISRTKSGRGQRRTSVNYRSFAYKHVPGAEGVKQMGRSLKDAPL